MKKNRSIICFLISTFIVMNLISFKTFALDTNSSIDINVFSALPTTETASDILKPSLSITEKSDIEALKLQYQEMRTRWFNRLTGNNVTDKEDETYKAEMINVADNAQKAWDSMTKLTDGVTNNNRTELWSEFNSLATGAKATASFKNLAIMATAYSASGCTLYHNSELKKDILEGLDWMYLNLYNDKVPLPPTTNWWDWDIGAPQWLCNVMILMYEDLKVEQIENQVKALNHFNPNPIRVPGQSIDMTGANLLDTTLVCLIKGIISESDLAVSQAKDAISRVFPYVTNGDGFYTDGSFIQHKNLPYAGGYGGVLMGALDKILFVLNETPWEITDPNLSNIYDWMLNSFEPLYYKGAIMDMVSGRGVSRFGGSDHTKGKGLLSSMLQLSYSAPPEKGIKIRSFIKENIQNDIVCQDYYKNMVIQHMSSVKDLLANDTIAPSGDLNLHKVYGAMDRVVHHKPGFSIGISMHSSRISAFEYGNKENKKGYNTGLGMIYLYNADNFQYSENYWPTVDMLRLSGTTTDKSTVPLRDFGNYLSPKDWVGGSSINDLYGATGMEFKIETSTLTGKKSWFSFDDEIVCIGSGITSTSNKLVETIVDNRKIKDSGDNEFTINGQAKVSSLGTTEKIEQAKWVFLGGNVGTDSIGYYFPKDTTITALREARVGNWKEINDGGPNTPITKNYLNMSIEHGNNPKNEKYSYVILPNKSSQQTEEYSQNPDITILSDTEDLHAVKENKLGLVGLNFWNASTFAGITSNAPASVMLKINDDTIEVSLSDPTQKSSTVELELSIPVTEVVSKDDTITVNKVGTKVTLSVNVKNSVGRSHKVVLNRDKNVSSEIIGITNLDMIVVDKGTEFEDIPLPEKITVTTGDINTHELDVKWESSNFNKENVGIYEVIGIIKIPQGLSNPRGIVAKIIVKVGSSDELINFTETVDDTSVQGDNANLSDRAILHVKSANISGQETQYDRKTVVKFDIKKIKGVVTDSVLELRINDIKTGIYDKEKFKEIQIFRIGTDWEGNTMKFKDIKRIGDNPLQILKIADLKTGSQMKVNVTEAVKTAIKEGATEIAFEISTPVVAPDSTIKFDSKESTVAPTLSWSTEIISGAIEINSITNPDAISVGYNTTESQLPLSKSVITTLANGSILEVPVTWQSSADKAYDGNILGEYTFEGTLNLPSGILNTANHKVTTTVNVIVNKISEVINPDNQYIEYGTTKDKLIFPQTVTVKLANNSTYEMPVSWSENSEPKYNGNVLGEYIFTGTLNSPVEISNVDGKVATIKINVVNYTLIENSTITTDDIFVQGDGLYTGTYSYLEARTTNTTNTEKPTKYDRKPVINFDITQMPENINEAFIELRVRSTSTGNKLTSCDLYRINADWSSEDGETSNFIKYKDIIRIGNSPLLTFSIKDIADHSDIKLDVTEAVNAAKAEGKTKVAFELIIPGNTDIGDIKFHSKNFTATEGKAPTLSWLAHVKVASEITKINNPEPINVTYGTTEDKLNLPNTITVELETNKLMKIPVNWSQASENPKYDGDKAGNYIFKGDLNLPERILNTAGYTASIEIIVNPKSAEQVKLENSIIEANKVLDSPDAKIQNIIKSISDLSDAIINYQLP